MGYFRVSQAAAYLNVSASSVRRYTNEGVLESARNPAGQRVFTQENLDKFLGKEPLVKRLVFYTRSSDGDNTKLATQSRLLEEAYGAPTKTYKDKASGLNEKRPGLQSLIKEVQKGGISHVAITEKDRLTRFGFSYLEGLFEQNGTTLIVLGEQGQKSLEEELLQDFMSLLASFSGKFYRMRGHSQQKALLNKAESALDEKTK